MTPELQRIEIAKACGWTLKDVPGGFAPQYFLPPGHTPGVGGYPFWGKSFPDAVPDYLNDLNACHEMEKSLTDDERKEYSFILCGYSTDDLRADLLFDELHTPAAQRAVAFLKAKKLWADTP